MTSWEQPSEEQGPSWHSRTHVCGQPGSCRWHVLPQHRRAAGSTSAVTSRQAKPASKGARWVDGSTLAGSQVCNATQSTPTWHETL